MSAAFALEKQRLDGAPLEIVLYEASTRLGGVIKTERIDDCVLEAGPDSFLTEKPWAEELCRGLGLEAELVSSNDAERKTYMVVEGRLTPIPDGLMFMVPTRLAPAFFSPLFSWPTKIRILREWFYRPGGGNAGDCTVAEFVERHYGREMVERVADPLLAGVYGGSADELSVNSVLSRFVDMEARYGSLGRALVSARKRNSASSPRPLFTSLRGGMQQMVGALIAKIPQTSCRLGAPIEAVRRESGKWLVVSVDKRTQEFDAAIVATPAYSAAALLSNSPDLANELLAIPYSSSVTAVLIYDKEARAALPPGFGFLVPRVERRRLLAATFVHNKFPHRAPADRAVIRCFLGGSRDQGVLESPHHQIQEQVCEELKEILGITAKPLCVRIHKWRRAMAQYVVGHSARVKRIGELLAETPGLALAGNAFSGIGVPDCVRSGSEAAAKVLGELGISRQPSAFR